MRMAMACNWAGRGRWLGCDGSEEGTFDGKSLGSNLDNGEHEHENMSKADACKTNINLGEEKTWSAQQSWCFFTTTTLFSPLTHAQFNFLL